MASTNKALRRPCEIREDVDRQLLAWTAPIPKAERRLSSIVADRQWLAVDDAVYGAKATVMQRGLSAVLDVECLASNGHRAKPISSHLASLIWWLVGALM
jgi:hypothetical protein